MATTPVQIQQTQYGFAPTVEPYAQDLLASAAGLTDINENPYMMYKGPTDAALAAASSRFAQFTPMQQRAFEAAEMMEPSKTLEDASALAGMAGLAGLGLQGQYRPTELGTQSFAYPGTANQYMNPYMGAINQQLQRQADIQRQQVNAQAAQAGAFGGARSGLMNQQINAELMRQQQQAQAQAYQNAQQQFNVEQQQRLANTQLGEQSRQFSANLGLQGLGTALQGAGQLGQLGGQQFGQVMGINQLQQQYGTQQQQQLQNVLSQAYQDYLNAQNYPYKQLGFMSDIIRGVPLTQTGTTLYQAPPSAVSQLAGLGTAAYGFSQLGKAKGGTVKSKPQGLAALALSQIK